MHNACNSLGAAHLRARGTLRRRTAPPSAPAVPAPVQAGVAALFLAVLALLTGCGSGGDPAGHASSPGAVPTGVAAQHAALEGAIAQRGGRTTSGAWQIGYVAERAQGWYESAGGRLTYRAPGPGETHTIGVVLQEAATGRLVPGMPVRIEVVDRAGVVVDAQSAALRYGDYLSYVSNVTVPSPGRYGLRVFVGSPAVALAGEAGRRPPLAEGAAVTFADVDLTPQPR